MFNHHDSSAHRQSAPARENDAHAMRALDRHVDIATSRRRWGIEI